MASAFSRQRVGLQIRHYRKKVRAFRVCKFNTIGTQVLRRSYGCRGRLGRWGSRLCYCGVPRLVISLLLCEKRLAPV
jgi:hypothetical protein